MNIFRTDYILLIRKEWFVIDVVNKESLMKRDIWKYVVGWISDINELLFKVLSIGEWLLVIEIELLSNIAFQKIRLVDALIP